MIAEREARQLIVLHLRLAYVYYVSTALFYSDRTWDIMALWLCYGTIENEYCPSVTVLPSCYDTPEHFRGGVSCKIML